MTTESADANQTIESIPENVKMDTVKGVKI